jgi:hypothetical protein
MDWNRAERDADVYATGKRKFNWNMYENST